jgi:DNA-directed RNA polymerase subunit M|tara:strand:- start:50 stop:394 length:345 start_codon:yes stop_codon:yes gene_type:complete
MGIKIRGLKMFCPKCGSVLLPKKDGNKKILICSCGYKDANVEKTKITETLTKKEKEVEIIEKTRWDILPKTKVECEDCGNKEAYFWTVQTRAGDEPETKFLRCTKCEHIWRDYD